MSSTSLWYTAPARGLVALVLFTLTMVLGITTTTRARSGNWPGFAHQELHRRVSMMAVVVLGFHILTSVMDTYVNIGWVTVVVPFASAYGRFWIGVGTIALDLMLAVFITSLLRARLRPGTWRAVHWLAYLSWPVALAHVRHRHRRRCAVGDSARRHLCRLRDSRAGVAAAVRAAPVGGEDGGSGRAREGVQASRPDRTEPGVRPCLAGATP